MTTANSHSVSRRSFLAGATALGALGVAGLAGCSAASNGGSEGSTAEKSVDKTLDTDLLIIGFGGSGLACAVQAGIDGTNCLVIEQAGESGGNSVGVEGMFAINSSMQKEAGVKEITPAEIISAQMQTLQYRPSGADWVEFCENSAENIEWCLEQGVEYSGTIDNYYTGDYNTFHWFKNNSCGDGYVPQMTARAEELGIEVLYNTAATELIKDESGAVVGAYAEGSDGDRRINAKAIVLATGGFCSNPDIIGKQGWDTTDLICMGPCGTGDGYTMALNAGAMDDIHNSAQSIVPFISSLPITDYKTDPSNPINGLSGIAASNPVILVDQNADRFVREDVAALMPGSSASLSTQRNSATYIIWDQNIHDKFFATEDAYKTMFDEAFESDGGHSMAKADTVADLAACFGLDAEALQATVDRYNESCAEGVDKDFSKDASYLVAIEKAPFYIARMCFTYYFSTGGLLVDKYQRVWDTEKNPIPGLYSAGNDGNNHYASAYTINIPGTAFGHQVNSGRKAAKMAREYIDSLQ